MLKMVKVLVKCYKKAIDWPKEKKLNKESCYKNN